MVFSMLVDILKQGSKTWNQWREEHPELSLIDLSESDLQGADLHNANLRSANLDFANLRFVNMSGADLMGASLSDAYLQGANLSHANMLNADLSYANLSDVNLSRTIIGNTVFAHVDLREVNGLTDINHISPSRVELHTIQLPQDSSALHFLRGVGVLEEWIDFYKAQVMRPVQYHSCFISYTHQNDEFVYRLHTDLQANGVRCWFAPHDMHIGDKIHHRINEAIYLQDRLLLILSEHSIISDWVEHEVETALARERHDKRTILFPIRLDNAILERPYTGWAATVQNERHIGDFTQWKDHDHYHTAFDHLLHDLKKTDN